MRDDLGKRVVLVVMHVVAALELLAHLPGVVGIRTVEPCPRGARSLHCDNPRLRVKLHAATTIADAEVIEGALADAADAIAPALIQPIHTTQDLGPLLWRLWKLPQHELVPDEAHGQASAVCLVGLELRPGHELLHCGRLVGLIRLERRRPPVMIRSEAVRREERSDQRDEEHNGRHHHKRAPLRTGRHGAPLAATAPQLLPFVRLSPIGPAPQLCAPAVVR
mmetsp:Transcript_10181/g.28796  ORF Transcript_10181/g.28796 Transcript_10181/m.28796 type:complete len:222 (+) Transcript_10181:83-748(+)